MQSGLDTYCFTGKQLRHLAHLMRRVGLVLWQQALLFPQVRRQGLLWLPLLLLRAAALGHAEREGHGRRCCLLVHVPPTAPLTPPPHPHAARAVQHITKLGTLRLDDPNNLHVEAVSLLVAGFGA